MHIAVRQGVDKINSLQADSLLSQEIDLELNKNMGKFINLKYGRNNIYGKGFEQSQKRIDDLSTLVKEYRGFTGFIDREQLAYSRKDHLFREFFTLPFDYMHHIESSCNVLSSHSCGEHDFRYEHFNDADYISNAGYESTSKVFYIPFSALEVGGNGYVSEITIRNGVEFADSSFDAEETYSYGAGGTSLSTLLWEYEGTFFAESTAGGVVDHGHIYKNVLIEDILTTSTEEVDIYWEEFGSTTIKDSFIVVISPDSDLYKKCRTLEESEDIEAALDAVDAAAGFYDGGYSASTVGGSFQDSAVHFHTKVVVGDTEILIQGVETEGFIPAKRMFHSDSVTLNSEEDYSGVNLSITYIQHDDLHALLRDPFNKPNVDKVLGVFTNNRIELFTLAKGKTIASAIPHSVKLKYLRNPLPMSLVNGVNCELPAHTHEEIVEMAISSLLEGFSDPRYKTHMNELNRNE